MLRSDAFWPLVAFCTSAIIVMCSAAVDLNDQTRYYAYRYDRKDLDGCTSLDNVITLQNRAQLQTSLFAPCISYWQGTRANSYEFKHNIIPSSYVAQTKSHSKACDVTLVTPSSLRRLTLFEGIAQHWDGPIILSFFGSENDAQLLKSFVNQSYVLNQRRNIMYNHVRRRDMAAFDYKKAEASLYPVNILRNDALLHVTTPFVFVVDIDTVPRQGLYHKLIKLYLPHYYGGDKCPQAAAAGAHHRRALVVPAFTSDVPLPTLLPKSKKELLENWASGNVFAGTPPVTYPQSQSATDYIKYRVALAPYDVPYEASYEPFVVAPTAGYPPYEKLLYWLFDDKPSNTLEMHLLNYTFTVLPGVFIVVLQRQQSERELLKWDGICQVFMQTVFIDKMTKKYGNAGRDALSTAYSYCFSLDASAQNACLCGS